MNPLNFMRCLSGVARWSCATALAAVAFHDGVAGDIAVPSSPDRSELWVPADKIGRVLDKNAVLLSREQYETLLRDAGVTKAAKLLAPTAAALTNAVYRAVPDGKTLVVRGELQVEVLRDGWAELPVEFPGAAIGEVKLEGEAVLSPAVIEPVQGKQQQQPQARRQAVLILRGRGTHRVTVELTAAIDERAGLRSFNFSLPGAGSGTFSLVLPAGAVVEKMGPAVKVTKAADGTTAMLALMPSLQQVAFAWKAGAQNDGRIPVRAQARVRYDIDAEKISMTSRLLLESQLGDLPLQFKFVLPADVKVLSVRADELRGWEAADGKITATLQDGSRKKAEIEITTELKPLVGNDAAATALPLPSVEGVTRVEGLLFIAGADNVIIRDVLGDSRLRRVPTADDRGERGFFSAYEFTAAGAAPRVAIQRADPTMEGDLDTLVEFRQDAIYVTRTLTLREQKGRRFATTITLPPGEEFLDVRRIEEAKPVPNQPQAQSALPPVPATETEPEWTRDGAVIALKWSDEAAKPRMFRVRTRVEPEKWTQLPAEGASFKLGDAKISGASKVTGYIALTADSAFRMEAQAGEMLERRDGRSTPVRGEYAWFRRDAFDLGVKIARRPSEVLAALTGYALPLEGVLDLHAVMNWQFNGGGTRMVKLRVPREIAQNFHFDGAQIAERALDGDVWTITFQKELTGPYPLTITAQVPVAKQGARDEDGGSAKGYSFSAKVPVITPLDVVRSSGIWAVEANTETEIRFEAKGMNELDSLLAPQLAEYRPRHRVIGVFGWLGADYALTLSGVRHAPAGMLTAVVDTLELNTVVSTSGTDRHEAVYRLRATGVEFLDVALPKDAMLLSVAIDGAAIKPVAASPGSVRLPLPARRNADAPVLASITYETAAKPWKSRGALALTAPALAKEIPVLRSAWHVWVPDGFSYSKFESNLPVHEELGEEVLAQEIGRVSLNTLGRLFAPELLRSRKRSQATQVLEDLKSVDSAIDQLSREKVETAAPRGEAVMPDSMPANAPNAAAADPQKPMSNVSKNPVDKALPVIGDVPMNGRLFKTAGLLPVTLDLPKDGREIVIEGLFAPERLVMRYDDWWGRAQRLWLWFTAGGIALWLLAGRRPWWRTLWATLFLTAVPLCVSASWTPVCNALLGGWLVGLVLHRIAARCVFRVTKEVLA